MKFFLLHFRACLKDQRSLFCRYTFALPVPLSFANFGSLAEAIFSSAGAPGGPGPLRGVMNFVQARECVVDRVECMRFVVEVDRKFAKGLSDRNMAMVLPGGKGEVLHFFKV